jgi:hypothetical protein
METSTDMWVKPFSTGLACVDTITSECIKNVSVDECVNMCVDSGVCSYGYHVQLPNEKDSYCLPINGLPYMDNTEIFPSSLYDKKQARVFSPNIGVDVTTFKNTDVISYNRSDDPINISQLNIYLLRCFTNITDVAHKNERKLTDVLYLQKDLKSWANDRNNAAHIIVSRDSTLYTALSTRDPRIRNGNLVFFNVDTKNLIYVFIDEETHGFYPRSIRSASSITYDVSDLYHTQIIKSVPFNDDFMTVNDLFQIRVATVPVNDHVYYWVMDTDTNTIKYEKVLKTQLLEWDRETNHNALYDKFTRFSFEQYSTIDTGSENFLSSQLNYMLDNYYYPRADSRQYTLKNQKSSYSILKLLFIFGGIFLILLTIILLNKRLF